MTTTGEQLVTLSGLPSSTALVHLMGIEVGSGTGVVVNDGIDVELAVDPYVVELSGMDIEVEVDLEPVQVEVLDSSVEVEIATTPIELEIT